MNAAAIDLPNASRRRFMGVSLAVGGGLLIGFSFGQPATAADAPVPPVDAYIRIAPDGRVTFLVPYAEMGQGALTSQAQILAEELDVAMEQVTVEQAPPSDALYGSPLLVEQITGGSASLRGAWITLRAVGATGRAMLVAAAAKRWNVRPSSCRTREGKVIHAATSRSLDYGDLASEAAAMPVPKHPVLKRPSEYRLVGKPVKRVDTPEKIDGTAIFGIDARPEGVRYAAVMACPVLGGTVAAVDAAEAMTIRGVWKVIHTDDAVAVIGDNTWAARKGLAALRVRWNEGANASLSTADLVAAADRALDQEGLLATRTGDVDAAERDAASTYEEVFRLPLLAHAAMEPLSCTVHCEADRCEVWMGSQVVARAQKAAAKATGLPLESVTVHNLLLGGGFGRRLEADYVGQAARLARLVEGPVKFTWSREEDMRHDYYRAHNHSRVTVAIDANGRPLSWRHRLAAPNIMARFLPIYQKDGVDLDAVDVAAGPYDIPNVRIEFVRHEAPAGLNTGNWRGVGPTRNDFITETVIDELAHRAGADPVDYRRAMMKGAPRDLAVLDLVVEKSGWGEPLAKGRGRGVALCPAFGSHVAMVAEVSVEPSGAYRVDRIVCAIDTGIVVNPDVVRAQIEGGAMFGISAVRYGRITVANGRVEQGNFDTYPVLRMAEAPKVEVHIVPSTKDPGGVGEPGTSAAIAAVANALFAATGKRLRSMPISPNNLREA
ncbi:molybdopterin cofactor-binding domain-containing protein [Luteibacter sp. NPDC031894]|uniref:xanthine dehydrogenase family protein molybdopterin-binding subunit n=1 Tax=Luteibacter sp. NPDC031894 TaxID=3390572 RepID=UPI003D0920D4